MWSPSHAAVSRGYALTDGSEVNGAAVQAVLSLGGLPPSPNFFDVPTNAEVMTNALAEARLVAQNPVRFEKHALSLLDEALEAPLQQGKRPALLFSGGIDSTLMAARLRDLGHDDLRLIHYSFSPDSDDSLAASAAAKELGLPLTVVPRALDQGLSCLADAGVSYPIPFADHSTAATFALCKGVAEHLDSKSFVVFDGTGADGAFGLGQRTTRLSRLSTLPSVALMTGSYGYRKALWTTRGRSEYLGRIIRRLSDYSLGMGSIAQNSLHGIVFLPNELQALNDSWDAEMLAIGVSPPIQQAVLTDLAITCAAIFAQKTFGPLSRFGFQVEYPFLSWDLGLLGLAHTLSFPNSRPKMWMRNALSHYLSHSFIERPKRGFIDPQASLFEDPLFIEHVHSATSSSSPISEWLIPEGTARLLSLRAWPDLPHGHGNLLWAMAFLDSWYRTRSSASSVMASH